MEDERALKAALKVEASQVDVPVDLLERILRQEPRVRPVRPGLWTRWGSRLEVLAACVVMAGLVGIAAMRGAHRDTAPSTDPPAPGVQQRILVPETGGPVMEVVTGFLDAARRGNHEQARSYWTTQSDPLTVAGLVAEYHAAGDRVALRVSAPDYRGGTASVPVTVSVNVEGDMTLSPRAIPIGQSFLSLRLVKGDWKIVSWVAMPDN